MTSSVISHSNFAKLLYPIPGDVNDPLVARSKTEIVKSSVEWLAVDLTVTGAIAVIVPIGKLMVELGGTVNVKPDGGGIMIYDSWLPPFVAPARIL